jgi:hypothetical protein
VWSVARPDRYTPLKDPVPILQEAGWAQGRAGCVLKILPPPGFDPRTVQTVVSHYTECVPPSQRIVVQLAKFHEARHQKL